MLDARQVEWLPGMPEPSVLCRHSLGGETVVSHGRRVVFRYADDDTAMRNLAVVALTDAGAPGIEVAATFGLSAEYVSRLRGRARRDGAAGLVARRGRPPKLSEREVAKARRWAGEGVTQTEIAARLKVARSVISELLARLGPLSVQQTLTPGTEAAGGDAPGADAPGADAPGGGELVASLPTPGQADEQEPAPTVGGLANGLARNRCWRVSLPLCGGDLAARLPRPGRRDGYLRHALWRAVPALQ